MIIPASPEFVALCQAQVLLLTQALGIASMAIYLAEYEPNSTTPVLTPVFVYPDRSPRHGAQSQESLQGLTVPGSEAPLPLAAVTNGELQPGSTAEQRLALPMVHENVVLGVLVCSRGAPWQETDRQHIEQVAASLALGCVLDQRGQWMQQRLQQKQLHHDRQSEHFHNLLHQFRNPLTAMGTFGKLLLKRLQPEDGNRSIAEGIVRESHRLEELVQQFDAVVAADDEELQKSSSPPSTAALALPAAPPPLPEAAGEGPWRLNLTCEPVEAVLRPLLVSISAVAQERQIRLAQGMVTDLPLVWMDAAALREVLSNLMDNALKYSPAGAWVWIATGLLHETSSGLYQGIAVGDTGPGIPEEDQGQVFERSYRGVQAAGDIPGTGLGLAIAQDLVVAMGGMMELYSPAAASGLVPEDLGPDQGPGTVFIVWLRQKP